MSECCRPIRVLVVDDSVVIRHALKVALESDPDIEVIGACANGKLALNRLEVGLPDLVALDLNMPVMDGFETLRRIRATYPKLRVIIVTAQENAKDTLDALELGADDLFELPSCEKSEQAVEVLKKHLVPKVKALVVETRRDRQPRAETAKPKREPIKLSAALSGLPLKAVVIGVSTGGPAALAQIIPLLPGDLRVPLVIVQHMPGYFIHSLVERLGELSKVSVVEGAAGMVLKPATVYFAPGDHHMRVIKTDRGVELTLDQGEKQNSCRPSADPLFESAAAVYGSAVLALLLTGMGNDGCRGAECIAAVGGRIAAQDQASSTVWGMPGAVVERGLAEHVWPLKDIAKELCAQIDGEKKTGRNPKERA